MYSYSDDIVFKFPHVHNAKIHSANSSSLWIFLFHILFEGIRLLTPSEALYDNSDTCILVTETFLKRFTFPVDNREGRGEGEAEFAPKYIHQTGGLIT